ncbi:hypothetical protein [Streptomyces sp. B21-083]
MSADLAGKHGMHWTSVAKQLRVEDSAPFLAPESVKPAAEAEPR